MKQLKDSLVLAIPKDPDYDVMKTYFEKGMREYYNLICGIQFEVSVVDDRLIRLYIPTFKQEKDWARRLFIEMEERIVIQTDLAYTG